MLADLVGTLLRVCLVAGGTGGQASELFLFLGTDCPTEDRLADSILILEGTETGITARAL